MFDALSNKNQTRIKACFIVALLSSTFVPRLSHQFLMHMRYIYKHHEKQKDITVDVKKMRILFRTGILVLDINLSNSSTTGQIHCREKFDSFVFFQVK